MQIRYSYTCNLPHPKDSQLIISGCDAKDCIKIRVIAVTKNIMALPQNLWVQTRSKPSLH